MRFMVYETKGNIVTCEYEDGRIINKELNELPFGIKPGDCLVQVENVICIDRRATLILNATHKKVAV